MDRDILHFAIGPVQSFVAQARRTRDLWAGSFLLSWLAGQAMAETLRQGGNIVFPSVGTLDHPQDPLLAAILDPPGSHPHIGSLPNRFKATVGPDFTPQAITDALRNHWTQLADRVWQRHLAGTVPKDGLVRSIWERQIAGFWDIQWVMGEDQGCDDDAAWLEQRKNWRTHWPPLEGGDHCTIMGDWQELSGCIRATEQRKQDDFWEAIRAGNHIGLLDLREKERLCAIALVKRLFPKLSRVELEETIGWVPGKSAATVGNWPSTAYMAAVPWLLHAASCEDRRKALHEYAVQVREQTGNQVFAQLASERATRLPALERLAAADMQVAGLSPADLDGNLFLRTSLENAHNTPLGNADEKEQRRREHLLKALDILNCKLKAKASSFFAILLMDGDRLGQLLQETDPACVSQALADFTQQVPAVVGGHNGVTIYAGGDDVLAMLPVSSAVECCFALREAYQQAFAELPKDRKPTVSCAIVFTHLHYALQSALKHAHSQLDDVAKDGNGRNSLALSVLLTGGVNNHWVAGFGETPQKLLELRDRIADEQYATSFFYNLFHRYGDLLGEETPDLASLDMQAVIRAEYCKGKPQAEQQTSAQASKLLLDACARQQGDGTPAPNSLQLDGAFIARFLVENSLLKPKAAEA